MFIGREKELEFLQDRYDERNGKPNEYPRLTFPTKRPYTYAVACVQAVPRYAYAEDRQQVKEQDKTGRKAEQKGWKSRTMAVQDDYVMRTITDLVKAIAGLALGKRELDYELPGAPENDRAADAVYRRLIAMADEGDINGAENELYEELDTEDKSYLEMALAFYMHLNQFDDGTLFEAGYSREEIVEGINTAAAQFGISGFEHFVDTTMV